ncbi:uncharacterized protein LOC124672837 [Lolium rigidum]|uniref:uncharacterized protein LOC124672837 n=1 Tax=Lolium rigidum TaxID=89674 RepID=UPI001F5C6AB2|nr:uncharacterized protein LOC124672837 [Lolium rigidum]
MCSGFQAAWLDRYLQMEQIEDSLGNFSGSDLFPENSFPSVTKTRMVKIHPESLQNIMHVLEVEYHRICDELGENERKNKIEISGSLEVKLDYMLNNLQEARKKRRGRWDEFVDVIQELEGYSSSMRPVQFRPSAVLLSHKPNLSLKRLRELKYLLKLFQKDKNTPRHFKAIYLLCDDLNLDFAEEIFKSDKEDDGSTVFMLEDVVKRLEVLKKERLTNTANDSNLERKLMEEISKKKKVLSELVSQSHLNAQDYELDFSMHDVKAGKEDATLIIKKLQGLIMKLKKELKLREDIIDGAEKIFNTHNEEIQLVRFRSEIGALLEKLETWESYHKEEFMYNEKTFADAPKDKITDENAEGVT